jgi:hypothetical protein
MAKLLDCLFLAATWRFQPKCSECGVQLGDIHSDWERIYCELCCPVHAPNHEWGPVESMGEAVQESLF